MLADILINDIK